MSIESYQETLFEDPLGLRFRHAREKLRWSQESVAQQLKLPVAVVEAIEREDWARLGAPIYVRSYVGSYAKLVGLPATLADEIVRNQPTPPLVTLGPAPRAASMFDRSLLNLGYLVMTVAILGGILMLASHFRSSGGMAQLLPLDPPVAAVADASGDAGSPQSVPLPVAADGVSVGAANAGTEASAPAAIAPDAGGQAPVMASLAPSVVAEAGTGAIVLRFRAESWLDVVDAAGQRVERGLVPAGSERSFDATQASRVTVGNADAVEVTQAGRAVDLTPFREANVARFTLSSDGRMTPVAGD